MHHMRTIKRNKQGMRIRSEYYLQFKLWQSGKASLRRWHLSQDLKGVRKRALRISGRNAFQVMKVKIAQSCPTLCHPMTIPSMEFSRPEYRSEYPFPSPGYLPNPGSNPGLLHCRRILYQLSCKGSPRILEWVAYPFSRESSQPRNQAGDSCIAGRSYEGRRANAKILSQE